MDLGKVVEKISPRTIRRILLEVLEMPCRVAPVLAGQELAHVQVVEPVPCGKGAGLRHQSGCSLEPEAL